MPFTFGSQFIATTLAMHGKDGEAWLRRLPTIITTCADQWNLTLDPPFPNLSYNYAAPAKRGDGTLAVLKIGYPGNPEFVTETEALRLFAGRGSVALLATDPANTAMLLERLDPGVPLSTITDDVTATAIAAGVMRLLPRPVPPGHPSPTAATWGLGFTRLRTTFDGGTGPFPAPLIDRAEHLFAELLSSSAEPTLIHGDLHHGNILSSSRSPWLAIDPKGLVGEPAYETGALLRNPLPDLLLRPDGAQILTRRIAQLAEALTLDLTRIRAWAFSQAILSAWWTYEDNDGDWTPALHCAELLATGL